MHVGYRYFDTFGRKVSYPFGYGLSYTHFAYSDSKVKAKDDGTYEVTVTVTNKGTCAGKEVVQLYAPVRDIKHQLVGFAKTNLLKPGQSQILSMVITPRDLSYFDEAQQAWVVAKGEYRLEVAANSRDVRQQVSLTLSEEKVLDKVHGKL